MKKLSFDSPQKALILSLFLLFFFTGAILLTFFVGQKALASYWQKKAAGEEVEMDRRIDYMRKSVRLENQNAARWRTLSQLFLAKANRIAREANQKENNEEMLQNLGQVSKDAISAAKRATNIDGSNARNWANLGDVYLQLIPYAQGSADQAVTAYEKAIEFGPNNPSFHLRKARAKYSQAQRISNQIAQLRKRAQANPQEKAQIQQRIESLNTEVDELLNAAQNFAQEAVDLKANYASAHLFLTNLYDVQGEIDEAINQLSNVVLMRPQNAGLRFQLGLLHYKNGDMEKAETAFKQAVEIDSDYANAHYFLGLAYSRNGQNEKAIEQFEKVAEMNPKNQEVKTIIDNLKEGKDPLAGIASEPAERQEAPVDEEQKTSKDKENSKTEPKSETETSPQPSSQGEKIQNPEQQVPEQQPQPQPQE